jgi:hypothetical protein
VLFADNKGTKDFAVEKNTKAPEGTAVGATTGGVIGGVLGWLAGIGTLAIPGVGPLVAAGPIVAALTGIGVGGTIGGIAGALIGMGFPEFEAKRYEGRIRSGGILLSVHCDESNWTRKAKAILWSAPVPRTLQALAKQPPIGRRQKATASRKLKPEASRLQMPGSVLLQAALAPPPFKARFMADFSVLALAAHDSVTVLM